MVEAGLSDRLLLRAKLYVPRGSPAAVPRPRLYERLDEGARRDLTVVSAPAGFGKTTLLAEWSRRCGLPVAWVSLDARDGDPVRFLSYVVAALGTLRGGFGEATRAFLEALRPHEGLEPVLTALSNEILEEMPEDFVLVLDDYHEIRCEAVHGALSFLLEHLPQQAHLVVAGRELPPLPLARLRARGQLVELDARDLRFTVEEAADFLGRTMGLDLGGESVAALEKETEGWVAGLQLAAHALRGREALLADAFAGGRRRVFEYLAEEVLSRQPEDVREFLLRTSVVETLNASLCEALAGVEDGRAMLERLEGSNLFLVPLDGEGRYYRYHHLFAAFLRERLRRARPGLVSELHRRAGRWYEADGCLSSAIDHALAAGDFGRAGDLIEEETYERRRYVENVLLLRWLRALPGELVRRRARLGLLYAWALVHSVGDLEEAERRLRDAEAALGEDGASASPPEERRAVRGEACIIRARMATVREEASLTVEFSNRALELLPESEVYLRGDAALDLGHAYCSVGDLEAAGEAFARAADAGRAARDLRTALFALRYGASLEITQGRLREAEALLREGQRLAEGQPEGPPRVAGIVDVGLGELLYERGELDEAQEFLERGIERGRESGEAKILVYGYLDLARVLMARGDAPRAHSLVREAGALTPRWPLIWAWRARFHLAEGDVEAAARWAREYATTEDYLRYPRHFERITMSRILLAEGRTGEALDSIERLLEGARSEGRATHEMELLLLRALALRERGEVEEALASLERALSLAAPEGFVRLFVDEGAPAAALLGELLRAPGRNGTPAAGYALRLLRHFSPGTALSGGGRPRGGALPGLEPLSEREL